jgi:starch synthase
MALLGLPEEYFTPDRLEFYGQINFMKAGIVYSDLISTVSKKYALEIQTSEYGERLDGLLRKRAQDLYGIINGIDYENYNPETDKHIYQNYNLETIDRKKENKLRLQKDIGLPAGPTPLIGMVSRLVDQKGLDLVSGVFEQLMSLGIQMVLLGSGDDHYQKLFAELKMKHHNQVAISLGFNYDLAQKIYAGADMFIMPSRFEPCGLSQLISLRYGTVPIVRAVGGLADTIENYDENKGKGNGFTFIPYETGALLDTIRRAVSLYRDRPDQWRQLMVNAMKCDFSWNRSAQEYVMLYEKAIQQNLAALYRVKEA